jgi:surfeit locus 1 family protein
MKLTVAGRHFAPPWWTLLLTALTMTLFYRLGVWQLHRADYKQELIQQYTGRAGQAPLGWSALQAKGTDVLAWPVRLQGSFDNKDTVLLDNQFEQGQPGYHILTVFRVGGGAVLVDRGWLASPPDRGLPLVPPATASVLLGSVALPSVGIKVGDEDYQTRPLRVLRLDIKALGTALGLPLQPYLIRLDGAATDGFVRRWPPVVNPEFGPEKSRGYAFQWFSMMVAVFIVFIVVNSKRISPE